MSSITDQGFNRTRLADILANLQASWKGIFGSDIDVEPDSPDGRALGVFAKAIDDATSLLEQTFNARSPAGATGAQLARVALINGVKKKTATFSTGVVTLVAASGPNVPVPAGSLIGNTADPTAVFKTLIDTTIPGGSSISDIPVQSTTTGPIRGGVGELGKILTVIPGWTGVTNPAAVTLGSAGETDPALRVRRAASVALPSQGLVDGLCGALLAEATPPPPGATGSVTGAGCDQAVVLENPADTTLTLADSSTLPPHSIEVITLGGLDADIAQTIWIKKAPGCSMMGTSSAVVTDSQGFPHTIKWKPATLVPIYVTIHTPSPLSSDVQDAIRKAFKAWGSGLLQTNGIPAAGALVTLPLLPGPKIGGVMPGGPGTQGYVLWSQIFVPINALVASYPTLFVTSVDIDVAPSPTLQANLPLNHDQIADFSDPLTTVQFANP